MKFEELNSFLNPVLLMLDDILHNSVYQFMFKQQVDELKAMHTPTPIMVQVCKAVCLLLNVQAKRRQTADSKIILD